MQKTKVRRVENEKIEPAQSSKNGRVQMTFVVNSGGVVNVTVPKDE